MRIVTVIAAAVLGLLSLGLLGAGALLLWGDAQKDEHGFISTATERFATTTYAMSTDNLDVDAAGADWVFGRDRWGTMRLEVSTRDDKPVFVGIARTGDVADYLSSANHDLVTDISYSPFHADYREVAGDVKPERPAAQDFWAASAHGAGTRALTWEVEDGDWSIVVMNADGSAGVDAGVKAGAQLSFLDEAGWVLIGTGLLALAGAGALLYVGVRPRRTAPETPMVAAA
jgi:hypothetical protein